MKLNAKQIQNATGGVFLVEPRDTTVFAVRIVIDSRKVECGDLFSAWSGKNVDGHDFVEAAIRNRASVVLVEKPIGEDVCQLAREMGTSIIQVNDMLIAITNIAKQWRACLKCKVLGLTGSSGKTSTKNLVRNVLNSQLKTSATEGNYNNELGVPITISTTEPDDEAVVVEMGMNHAGEIADLCKISQPDYGLITNVGESHIEYLGSRENIAKAKAELVQALPDTIGKLFLHKDDDFTDFIIDYAKVKERGIELILFGGTQYDENYDCPQVWAEDIEFNEEGCPSFSIHTKGFNEDAVATCRLKLRGSHNIINACGAAAVGLIYHISLYDSVKVLNKSNPESGRLETIKCPAGYTIINDAYNANPESMKASLLTFDKMHTDGKRIAVLGDMLELGKYSKPCHEAIGKLTTNLKIDTLICVGEEAQAIAGCSELENVIICSDNREALQKLEGIIMQGDLVLIKASNSMRLDYIVKGLVN